MHIGFAVLSQRRQSLFWVLASLRIISKACTPALNHIS